MLRRPWQRWGLLAGASVAAVVSACGAPAEPAEPVGMARPHAPRRVEGEPAPSAPAPAPGGAEAPAPPSAGPGRPSASPVVMRPPVATAMERELRELGIDARALPTLDRLPPDKLRGVMNTFTKALGVPCSHCHDTSDFRAPTANKRIARRMWDDVTRGLSLEDGGPLYCDSCHGGRAELLDRADLEALGAWMAASYVDALRRVDGGDHGCETCHGEPFEPRIFSKRWR